MTMPAKQMESTLETRPVPDPTVLTTQQLFREMSSIRELIASVREIIETRLDGYDRAIRILQDIADKFPARMDEKIEALKTFHEEKFSSIQTQFKERDVRTDQMATQTKVAVDAALQAAEKAVGKQNEASSLSIAKSEAATMKQIDGLGTLIGSTNAATDGKIGDIKERLTRIEGKDEGKVKSVEQHQASTGLNVAILVGAGGIIFGIAGIALGVFSLLRH